MANGGGDIWMLSTVLGVVLLGAALAYAMLRNRGTTKATHQQSERATRDVYAAENKDEANKSV